MTAASRHDNPDQWVSGGHEKFETPAIPVRDGEHPAATRQLELIPRCPNCHGTGKNRFGVCAYCKGTGQTKPRRSSQLTELPPGEFEDIFACQIDESAGLKDQTI